MNQNNQKLQNDHFKMIMKIQYKLKNNTDKTQAFNSHLLIDFMHIYKQKIYLHTEVYV